MKTLLFILLFVPCAAIAQKADTAWNCDKYTTISVDKMKGDTSRVCIENVIVSANGSDGFSIALYCFHEGIITMVIRAYGASSCIDRGSEILILLTDGTRVALKSESDFNCDNKATVYFGGSFGKRKDLNNLLANDIETMRIWTEKSYVQEDFTVENRKDFRRTLNCLDLGM